MGGAGDGGWGGLGEGVGFGRGGRGGSSTRYLSAVLKRCDRQVLVQTRITLSAVSGH